MGELVQWLNANSAAVQAASTVVLVAITTWYAWRTHRMASAAEEQLALVRRSHEPNIVVEVTFGVTVPDMRNIVSMNAANRGQMPVTLREPVMVLPDKRAMNFIHGFLHADARFPNRLEPGDGCSASVSLGELARALIDHGLVGRVKVRARYSDQAGRQYESEPVEINPPDWAGRA